VNNEQIKALLLETRPCATEFSLIMSGKASKRVDGLYKPEAREIILHNKNFASDGELVYTALHEYAHHLHAESRGGTLPSRCHGRDFWATFHSLLEEAKAKGLYRDVLEEDAELKKMAERIRGGFLAQNGKVMKELGSLLSEAEALCRARGANFEDFVDRALGMSRATAKASMRMAALDVDPALGYDSMRIVAGVRDPDKREAAERELRSGKSLETVKAALTKRLEDRDPLAELERERARIQRTIDSLTARLEDIDKSIERMEARA
jgi:hypothetical protein